MNDLNTDRLPNLKALGIEKDMNDEFKFINKTELQKLIDSYYFEHPYIARRPDDGEYCEIEVLQCSHDNWWYRDLIGYRFFCIIRYVETDFGIKYIKEFSGVKLTNTKMITFRNFKPQDVMIV